MDAPEVARDLEVGLVEALAEGVEHVALDLVTHGDRDRAAEVGDLLAADQAVGGLHRDGADQVVTQVLRDLQGQGLREVTELDVHGERAVELRNLAARELDVDDRAGDPDDPAGPGLGGRVGGGGHQLSLPAVTRASAPPTISLISWVICA